MKILEIEQKVFMDRLYDVMSLQGGIVSSTQCNLMYKKLCNYEYDDFLRACDEIEEGEQRISYIMLKRKILERVHSRNEKKTAEQKIEHIEIRECTERKCLECFEKPEIICMLLPKEVLPRLPRLMDKDEKEAALNELDWLFPEAGFLIKRNKSKGVVIVNGEMINVY